MHPIGNNGGLSLRLSGGWCTFVTAPAIRGGLPAELPVVCRQARHQVVEELSLQVCTYRRQPMVHRLNRYYLCWLNRDLYRSVQMYVGTYLPRPDH